jgi:hypothetical protein
MEFKGKIIAVVKPKSETTARDAWKIQQFVAESEGQFPHRLLFEVFGDEKLQKFNIRMDDEAIIQFDLIHKRVKVHGLPATALMTTIPRSAIGRITAKIIFINYNFLRECQY